MKKIALLSSALLLASSLSFAGSIQSLNKSEATKQFQGNTITTIPMVTLNNELINNTFTGYFDKDGTVTGKLSSEPSTSPQKDTGKWTVKSDGTVCVTWDHWNDGKSSCVTAYKLTNAYLLVNTDNKKFESLILKDDIKSGNTL